MLTIIYQITKERSEKFTILLNLLQNISEQMRESILWGSICNH